MGTFRWKGDAVNASEDDIDFHLPTPGEDDRPGIEELIDDDDILDDDLVDEDDLADDEELADDYYPEDATEDDIDVAVALYREDGQPTAVTLDPGLVNDLDAMIEFLRRLPGDAGAIGMVSLVSEVFVIVRVRGKTVQVFLSDALAAEEWPIAHDIADYLGEDIPEDDDDAGPLGDGAILADAGLHEIDLDAIASDYDEDTTVLLERIATKIQFGPKFREVLADE